MPRDPGERTLSSPNGLVWQHFEWLRRNINRIIRHPPDGTELAQDCAAVIMLSVSAVEVFVNAYFGVIAFEKGSREQFIDECRGREKAPGRTGQRQLGFRSKLETWFERYFGQKIAIDRNRAFKPFFELKDQRNDLVHFWDDMSGEFQIPNGPLLKGMVNTYEYMRLRRSDVFHTYNTVEDFIREVFKLSSVPDSAIPVKLHYWTARGIGCELPWHPWTPQGAWD